MSCRIPQGLKCLNWMHGSQNKVSQAKYSSSLSNYIIALPVLESFDTALIMG